MKDPRERRLDRIERLRERLLVNAKAQRTIALRAVSEAHTHVDSHIEARDRACAELESIEDGSAADLRARSEGISQDRANVLRAQQVLTKARSTEASRALDVEHCERGVRAVDLSLAKIRAESKRVRENRNETASSELAERARATQRTTSTALPQKREGRSK